MTKDQIYKALKEGKKVFWKSDIYEVIPHEGTPFIRCKTNGRCIGLHGKKGTKYENELNGNPNDFYIKS